MGDADTGESFEPGSFGCHGPQRMAAVFATLIDGVLGEHPAIAAVPEWRALVEQASRALRQLHQAIGAVRLDGISAAGSHTITQPPGRCF